jgi:hypothetical protein
MVISREHPTEGRQIDVLQLMLEASEVSQAETISSSKKPLSDDEIVANSWIFLLGTFQLTFLTCLQGRQPN